MSFSNPIAEPSAHLVKINSSMKKQKNNMSILYKDKYLHIDIAVTWFCVVRTQLRDNPDRKSCLQNKGRFGTAIILGD